MRRLAPPPGRGETAEPWQRELYEQWAVRLGEEKMRDFLRMLDDELRALRRLIGGPDRAALRGVAHDVAATAGMLGFCEVTRRCRAVLEAKDEGRSIALSALDEALAAALERLGQYLEVDRPGAKAA